MLSLPWDRAAATSIGPEDDKPFNISGDIGLLAAIDARDRPEAVPVEGLGKKSATLKAFDGAGHVVEAENADLVGEFSLMLNSFASPFPEVVGDVVKKVFHVVCCSNFSAASDFKDSNLK